MHSIHLRQVEGTRPFGISCKMWRRLIHRDLKLPDYFGGKTCHYWPLQALKWDHGRQSDWAHIEDLQEESSKLMLARFSRIFPSEPFYWKLPHYARKEFVNMKFLFLYGEFISLQTTLACQCHMPTTLFHCWLPGILNCNYCDSTIWTHCSIPTEFG